MKKKHTNEKFVQTIGSICAIHVSYVKYIGSNVVRNFVFIALPSPLRSCETGVRFISWRHENIRHNSDEKMKKKSMTKKKEEREKREKKRKK